MVNTKLMISHSAQIVQKLCENFPDPRKKRGIRYSYKLILHLIILATIMGCHHVDAIGDFIHSRKSKYYIKKFYNHTCIPGIGCIRYLMLMLDADKLLGNINDILKKIQDAHQEIPLSNNFNGKAIAIDGKTLRGAHAYGDNPPAYLNAVFHGDGLVISHKEMQPGKTNEIVYLQEMLEDIDIKGFLITLDAIHTQTKTAKLIADKNAFYLLTVKGNQPNLKSMIEDESLNSAPAQYEEQAEKVHGRIEVRRIWTSFSPKHISAIFPYAKQIFLIEREIFHISKNKITTELCYGITNLTREQADPKKILAFNRGHWTVENKLHHSLDVSMHEDACRCRTGKLPFVLSAFRKLALNLFRMVGTPNIAKSMRQLAFT